MATHDSNGGTLEQRLRVIEDRLEIYNLIAAHPPSADTGVGEYTASVWTEDGVFDRGADFPRPSGPAAIAATSTSGVRHCAISGARSRKSKRAGAKARRHRRDRRSRRSRRA